MAQLNVRRWGSGARTAVLLHGIMADAGSWWAVGPALAERGYAVLALDLPGHGRSPRQDYTMAGLAAAVLRSVPAEPELAIGHSLGGVVLAQAVAALRPARAVYEDPPWGPPAAPPRAELLRREPVPTREQLAARHPRWPVAAVEEGHRARELWDPDSNVLRAQFPGSRSVPPALVVTGDGDVCIDAALADRLRAEGHQVAVVPAAGHNVHNDNHDGFLAALVGWL